MTRQDTKPDIYKDQEIVWYGPHACQRCDHDGKNGTMIVKAGNGAPDDLEYDFVHDSHYPGHIWHEHKCGQNRNAKKLGSAKSKKKASAAKANGKKGGRPKLG